MAITKRFIVLIDFSDNSKNLLNYACNWCTKSDAELLLIHQTSTVSPAYVDASTKREIIQQTKNERLAQLNQLTNQLVPKSVKTSFSIPEKKLQTTLKLHLAEPYINLIFTGLKETGFLKKIFLGTTTLKIIENINNIVVAVPENVATYSQQKIFVAVAENHPVSKNELDIFLKFINPKVSKITFFNLAKSNENTEKISQQLEKLTQDYAEKFNTNFKIYNDKNPTDDIKKIIHHKEDEILVIQKGSRLLTDHLLRRFFITDLVHDAQTPLVVLP